MLTKEEAQQLLFWFDDDRFNATTGPEDEKDPDIRNTLNALNKLHKFCGMEPYKPWWKNNE